MYYDLFFLQLGVRKVKRRTVRKTKLKDIGGTARQIF